MSNFTIDYILNRAGEKYLGTNASMGLIERIKLNAYQSFALMSTPTDGSKTPILMSNYEDHPEYDWLQYSRYRPPKLPRSLRPAPAKRTPGRLPRIPFTPTQLMALENAYKKSNYLSAEEANKLGETLELTNTRVKIWFQNRRARERREKRDKDEHCDSTMSSNASSPEPETIIIV